MDYNYGKVPQWMIDSKTDVTEQNDVVGLVVAEYIGAFRKRGFLQNQMGIMLASAFLLPVEEVEKRMDAVLSCAFNKDEESIRNLCAFAVEKGNLFSVDDTDPCEIIGILKGKYGNEATVDTILTFPQILHLWKKSEVRDLPENMKYKEEVEKILYECSCVFPELN